MISDWQVQINFPAAFILDEACGSQACYVNFLFILFCFKNIMLGFLTLFILKCFNVLIANVIHVILRLKSYI